MFDVKTMMKTVLGVALASLVLMTTGCDDDDSGGDPVGDVTVQGNISDFDAGTVSVVAGLQAGITVKIKGTTYSTLTADDGTFVISGIVAGNHILVISYGDKEIEYPLGDIPENSRIEISNMSIRLNGEIIVEKVDRIDLGTNKKTTLVDDEEEEIINVAGSWKWYFGGLPGKFSSGYQMELQQDGNTLTGTIQYSANRKLDGTIDGKSINLTVTVLPAGTVLDTIKGTVNDEGTEMSGTWTGDGGTSSGTWAAIPGLVD